MRKKINIDFDISKMSKETKLPTDFIESIILNNSNNDIDFIKKERKKLEKNLKSLNLSISLLHNDRVCWSSHFSNEELNYLLEKENDFKKLREDNIRKIKFFMFKEMDLCNSEEELESLFQDCNYEEIKRPLYEKHDKLLLKKLKNATTIEAVVKITNKCWLGHSGVAEIALEKWVDLSQSFIALRPVIFRASPGSKTYVKAINKAATFFGLK